MYISLSVPTTSPWIGYLAYQRFESPWKATRACSYTDKPSDDIVLEFKLFTSSVTEYKPLSMFIRIEYLNTNFPLINLINLQAYQWLDGFRGSEEKVEVGRKQCYGNNLQNIVQWCCPSTSFHV